MPTSNSWKNEIVLGLSAGIGGFIAAVADLAQKDKAAAVLKMADTMTLLLSFNVPPIYALSLLTVFSIFLYIVFEPNTKKNSFYLGASVIAMIMTVTPYNTPRGLDTQTPKKVTRTLWYELFIPNLALAQKTDIQDNKLHNSHSRIQIELTTDDGKKVSEAIVTLEEFPVGNTIASTKFIGDKFSFYQASGKYIIRIEVSGYKIVRMVIDHQKEDILPVVLESTLLPLVVQRLKPGPIITAPTP